MSVDPDQFREAMRNWTSGVCIVSAQFEESRHGMTVSSFTSVSLHPSIVLVSLENQTRTFDLVEKSGFFGVTILGTDQKDLSDRFAGRSTENSDRFAGLEVKTLVSNSPFLTNNLACFDCQVVHLLPVSTQTLVVGQVLALENNLGEDPLVYFNQAYRKLQG